ncbi:MAG: hypothetical protein GY873_02460, partial [Bosea sp.]|uniref:phage tail length tape measure family protein n=1 Tax=Bosea sp. (in: a-proteobacteria) TaxID=1871050 RepID=UPI0023976BCD|nr:hypothetical protein [Bosea sp. (in: a-proteobacteria)]
MAGAVDHVALTYTADIRDVIKKLKQASDLSTGEVRKIGRNLNTMARRTTKATTANKGYTKSTNTAALAARNLAVQLPDVAQQLGAGVAPMTVLTQQGGQVAQSMLAAGVSLSGMLAILGPVAVAAAALGATYLVLQRNLTAANERMEEQRAKVEGMAGLYRSLKDAATLAA